MKKKKKKTGYRGFFFVPPQIPGTIVCSVYCLMIMFSLSLASEVDCIIVGNSIECVLYFKFQLLQPEIRD